MFEMIKEVISAHTYKDSNALIAKIQRMYVEGELTEEQYTELRVMLNESSPVKAYDAEAEIDKIWVAIRVLEAKLDNVPTPEPSDEIPDWVQPTGAHDAYQRGDKVRFNGDVYESLIDGNVWSPETYPAGWQKLLQGEE